MKLNITIKINKYNGEQKCICVYKGIIDSQATGAIKIFHISLHIIFFSDSFSWYGANKCNKIVLEFLFNPYIFSFELAGYCDDNIHLFLHKNLKKIILNS